MQNSTEDEKLQQIHCGIVTSTFTSAQTQDTRLLVQPTCRLGDFTPWLIQALLSFKFSVAVDWLFRYKTKIELLHPSRKRNVLGTMSSGFSITSQRLHLPVFFPPSPYIIAQVFRKICENVSISPVNSDKLFLFLHLSNFKRCHVALCLRNFTPDVSSTSCQANESYFAYPLTNGKPSTYSQTKLNAMNAF